jgi:hypothetical protein
MPIVHFTSKNIEIRAYHCATNIPQDIIDEGDDAIKNYIQNECIDIKCLGENTHECSVKEETVDISNITISEYEDEDEDLDDINLPHRGIW